MGEATYTVGQLLVTGLLSKVQNLSSATRQSKFQNSFHTFLFCFLSETLSLPDQDHEWHFMGKGNSIVDQLFVLHLLYTNQDP